MDTKDVTHGKRRGARGGVAQRDPGAVEQRVATTVRELCPMLQRLAARHSLCADDADDAVAKALEVYARRAHGLDPETERRWLAVVVRHEAMRISRSRYRHLPVDVRSFDQMEDVEHADADETLASYDRLGRSAEALKSLTPEQVAAILEHAVGFSYGEIARRHGWTERKAARSLSEGRQRFHSRYGDIERGRECRRWERVVRAMGEGRASERLGAMVRPHLAHCAACRRALGDHSASRSPAAGAARGCAA